MENTANQNSNDKERLQNITDAHIVTPGELVIKRFARNKLAIVGIYILAFMALFAVFGPMISPYGEYEIFFLDADGVEFRSSGEAKYENATLVRRTSPEASHWLGTDSDGRDVLTRLMYGGRISLTVGFVVVIIELVIGITLGGVAGFYGGKIDNIIMRVADIFYCIPSLPCMLILSSVMNTLKVPQNLGIYFLMLVLGILGWAYVARFIRGQILTIRELEFMAATEAVGLKTGKRIFRHLLPNVMPQIIVMATMGVGSVILTESALSFLGLGLKFPYASWGNMVSALVDPIVLKQYLFIWVPPGVCILLTVLGFNFVGDGLRDAFDPKMKR